MAWITPVTNRQTGLSRMTYTDMKRITGNINYLFDVLVDLGYVVIGDRVPQTDWTRNDLILDTFWVDMLQTLSNICRALSYTPPVTPNNSMEYTNINNIESIILKCYNDAIDGVLYTQNDVAITTENGEAIIADI